MGSVPSEYTTAYRTLSYHSRSLVRRWRTTPKELSSGAVHINHGAIAGAIMASGSSSGIVAAIVAMFKFASVICESPCERRWPREMNGLSDQIGRNQRLSKDFRVALKDTGSCCRQQLNFRSCATRSSIIRSDINHGCAATPFTPSQTRHEQRQLLVSTHQSAFSAASGNTSHHTTILPFFESNALHNSVTTRCGNPREREKP